MPTQTRPVAAGYNGWSNYETWLANLWLNNDQYSYRVLLDAKECGNSSREQADWLKDQLEMQLEQEIDPPCLWRDLLHSAFYNINWVEIVEAV